jgi:hypothetical protein
MERRDALKLATVGGVMAAMGAVASTAKAEDLVPPSASYGEVLKKAKLPKTITDLKSNPFWGRIVYTSATSDNAFVLIAVTKTEAKTFFLDMKKPGAELLLKLIELSLDKKDVMIYSDAANYITAIEEYYNNPN